MKVNDSFGTMTLNVPMQVVVQPEVSEFTYDASGPIFNVGLKFTISLPAADVAKLLLDSLGGRGLASLAKADSKSRAPVESPSAHTSVAAGSVSSAARSSLPQSQESARPFGPPGLDLPQTERPKKRERATWTTPLSAIQPTHADFRAKHSWNSESVSAVQGGKGPLYLVNAAALRMLSNEFKKLSPPARQQMTHDKLRLVERAHVPAEKVDPSTQGKVSGDHQAVGSSARPNLGQPPTSAPPPPPAVKSPSGGKAAPMLSAKVAPPNVSVSPPTKAPPSASAPPVAKSSAFPPLTPVTPGEVKDKDAAIPSKAKHEPAPKAKSWAATAKVNPSPPAE